MAAALAVAGKKLWSRGDLLPQDHTIIELVVEALQRISVLMKPCAADGVDLVLARSLPDVQQVCGLMAKVAVRSDDRSIPWVVLPDVAERQRDPEPNNEKVDQEKMDEYGGKLNEDASTSSKAKPEYNNTCLNPDASPFVPVENNETSHMDTKPEYNNTCLNPDAMPFVPGRTWVSSRDLDVLDFASVWPEVHDVAVPEDEKIEFGFEKPASPVPSEDGSSSSGRSSLVHFPRAPEGHREGHWVEGDLLFVDGAMVVD